MFRVGTIIKTIDADKEVVVIITEVLTNRSGKSIYRARISCPHCPIMHHYISTFNEDECVELPQ